MWTGYRFSPASTNCFYCYALKCTGAKRSEGSYERTLSTIFIFHPFPKFLGLCAAGHNLQIEWAVIKGVSDYANGSKNATGDRDWQPFASAMAASVVYNMFKYPDVLKHWPNYQKPGTTKGTEIQLDM
jgi:hypothetical protein